MNVNHQTALDFCLFILRCTEQKTHTSLYSRYYAEACNNGGAHLRDLASGQRSSEETLLRWRHCVRFDRRGMEPQTSLTDSNVVTTELTDQKGQQLRVCQFNRSVAVF